MAEFKISRLRYRWRGNWATATSYIKDDIIHYAGSSWYCIRAHTSTTFYDAQSYLENPGDTSPTPAWAKMTEGRGFEGTWTPSTSYAAGGLVLHGGTVYVCVNTHESQATFSANINDWNIFALGSNWVGAWSPNTLFRVGDIVKYNGITYQCILEHTSSTTDEGIVVGVNDADDEPLFHDSTTETWKIIQTNQYFRGDWAVSTKYRINDLVQYGGGLFECNYEHTSSATADLIDPNYFTIKFPGYKFRGDYATLTRYAQGDVVRQGGNLYIATTNIYDDPPGVTQEFPAGNTDWEVISKGSNFMGAYSNGTAYKQGDLVKRGGSLWVALEDDNTDGSTLDYLDASNWELIIPFTAWRGVWEDDAFYHLYDIVYFQGSTYKSNVSHFASVNNFPGDNGSGFQYWDLLTPGDLEDLSAVGDLVKFDLYKSNIGDGSSLGPTSIPIGSEDQLLVVESDPGEIGYKTWGNINRVFHVRTNGVDDIDDPNRGINYFKPYRTVRFACEQADDGFAGTTTIKISSGEYEEILPIIVPVRTAVVGEELRSVTIKANDPITALGTDYTYTRAALIRISLIIEDLLLGNAITVSAGNTEHRYFSPIATLTESNLTDGLISTVITYLDYHISETGTNPTVVGTNTASTNANILAARQNLLLNKEFLAQEAVSYIAATYPAYTFDSDLCKRDIRKFVDAWRYDLLYTGNYKSILAGRYYANAVNGSSHEDMFYVRDTTGIRNMTLKGLVGTLPNPVGSEPYSRPTGGNYVSLDPGWGPADDRTWITNRSCYVQNVTTFGYGATGQKIDGSLHNGGNKSIVSNDFTQVISDGIGCHVLNGGRAELVSVFTYYSHIGMFAEDGGIIRATNGNSSYGDFGAIADGNDPTETVQLAKVNTRNNEAIVASAFAGEVNDYILIMEFSNAGQNYTNANYTIVGSGVGASVIQEEFRDNALFECKPITSGADYILAGNNAQTGNTTTITLATNDNITAAEIIGTRIIITSGEGTGQYGYVQAYNAGTKICTVYRESDDQPGWDHVVPGTPSASFLTTGSRYQFEPRLIFSDPGFTASAASYTSAGVWASATYGETVETYSSVPVNNGTATFNVVKTGTTYTVTLDSGGTLYSINDELVIDGANVGGVTGEHDIDIRVTNVSTGVITTFSYVGLGITGRFVLTPTSGSTGIYSRDGITWNECTLPSSGNWKSVAAGNNKFVAIRYNSNVAASSVDGATWTARTLPSTRNWNSVVYGGGIFVAVAGDQDAGAISTNGTTWTSTTLPNVGDSTQSEWIDIAYGHQKFVALANSNNAVAIGTYDSGTGIMTWSGVVLEVQDSSPKNWTSIAYGNGRFVAVTSTGDVSYSFNGTQWYTTANGMPNQGPTTDVTTITPGNVYTIVTLGTTDFTILGAASNTIGISFVATQPGTVAGGTGSVKRFYQEFNWRQIRYGQGVFFAVAITNTNAATTYAATSYDGIVWTPRELASSLEWSALAFGNPDISLGDSTTTSNRTPVWVAASSTSGTVVNRILTGARALGRIIIESTGVTAVRLWEPGSGYNSVPTLSLTDPNNTTEATFRSRIADGVLGQPTFLNRGTSYKTSTTSVTITGDGFADILPQGKFITIDGLTSIPGPGAQLYIGGSENYLTAVVVGIDVTTENGTLRSTFQVSPQIPITRVILDDTEVQIRERYSQVRITGHDFLDVGTGNFVETNYPELYVDYDFTNEPQNEVGQLNGGRVFYTSTDQDGNFRAGELFAVEQATGTVTISADFFDLQGLTELALGGVTVGGSGTIIREFSTDPLFTANSNNIVPTQRAIVSYLQSRLNIGGEDLLVPSIIAGTVKVGPNLITNTAGLTVDIPVIAEFDGPSVHLQGSWLAQNFFFRSFKDDGQ